jgi:protoporphyrinogen/coproporphyrinogen III oxidase
LTDGERSVAVIGGGVSGLTTALRLFQRDPSVRVTVFEADEIPGGKLRSVEVGGLMLPAGADSFLARKPWAVDLCRELGLGAELIAPGVGSAFLWTDHGLEQFVRDAPFGIPGDVTDVLSWPGLSRGGRARAAKDLLIRGRKDEADESLGSLLRRRLGDEATELAVAPLLEGLFAGDAERLSVLATFPELRRWETFQGSLIRGSQAASRDARRGIKPGPMFLKPRSGVERLTDAIAKRLGKAVRPGARVTALQAGHDGYSVDVEGVGSEGFDAVVLAVPSFIAAELLGSVARPVAAELTRIPYSSTGVVLSVYPQSTARELPEGSGFVVPRGMAPMTACTFLSNKWPEEAFGTRAVVRFYVGGVGAEDILDATDAELVQACAAHLAAVVPLPEAPEDARVVRWPGSMPQYEVGHLDLVARAREGLPPGIFVTGQAYDGVGIPDCVRAAADAAEAVVAYLNSEKATDKETVP